MSRVATTSTGHEASDAPWIDLHYRSSRPEYQYSLRSFCYREFFLLTLALMPG